MFSKSNPQTGSMSSGSGNSASCLQHPLKHANCTSSSSHNHKQGKKDLPPLFWYMELAQWDKAAERLRRHPREAKTWATIRTRSEWLPAPSAGVPTKVAGNRRLALHHACFKLRTAGSVPPPNSSSIPDPFLQVCSFILMLIRLYPEAAKERESRHGCLPLHLAAFASCAPKEGGGASSHDEQHAAATTDLLRGNQTSILSLASSTATTTLPEQPPTTSSLLAKRPQLMTRRVASDATNATTETNLSQIHAEETYTGGMKDQATRRSKTTVDPNVSVAMKSSSIVISSRREEMAVQVLNALLDAYPKGVRVDSEGGRMPLHTACAGRATPRIISTLVTAYPPATRHRNKDGFLPLHLAAHWGVSHPNVAITLLKAYPDATVGRNRWERTPLEEALCMAGENGRPHQAALVRALRKHPSFWSRPTADLFATTEFAGRTRRRNEPTTVDIDESLPSNESSLDRDSYYGQSSDESLEVDLQSSGFKGKLTIGKGVKPVDDPSIGIGTLIQSYQWDSILLRLENNPLAAEHELEVTTRGGFTASAGFTPLHYACERQPPVAVVEALITANPMAVLTRTMPGGALPLHVACTWFASNAVVAALVSADPSTCRVTDELGNVPLHSACFSGSSTGAIEALLAAEPASVMARNHQGSRPVDVCKRLRHPNRKVVMALLTAKKEMLLVKHRRKGSGSSGTWSELMADGALLNDELGNIASSSPARSFYRGQMAAGDENLDDELAPGAIEVAYEIPIASESNTNELVWI